MAERCDFSVNELSSSNNCEAKSLKIRYLLKSRKSEIASLKTGV